MQQRRLTQACIGRAEHSVQGQIAQPCPRSDFPPYRRLRVRNLGPWRQRSVTGTADRGRRESSFASCHADGLWPSSEGLSHLFRRGWLAVSTALWGFNSVLSGFNSAARVIWAGSRGLRLRCGDFRTAAGGCHHACPVMGRRGADAPSGPGLQLDSG